MKKVLNSIIFLIVIMGIVLSGCSDNKSQSSVESTVSTESVNKDELDLTALSSTMVYSEVYNIMMSPEQYIGRTIKMKGQFATTYDETTSSNYFAVIIADATACCQQGIEFVWNGDHAYPDDYPAVDTEVEVSGVFQSYVDTNGETYYHIVTDNVNVL